MRKIERELVIESTAAALFEALSTTAGVRSWWTADAEVSATVGEACVFRFERGTMVIEALVDRCEPACVAWRCVAVEGPPWQGTTLTFQIAEEGPRRQRLTFVHGAFAEGVDPEPYGEGWDRFLGMLKQYAETGEGEPHGG